MSSHANRRGDSVATQVDREARTRKAGPLVWQVNRETGKVGTLESPHVPPRIGSPGMVRCPGGTATQTAGFA